MTADELAEMFVPVPMRWRHIKYGDVIVGKDGQLWTVAACEPLLGPNGKQNGNWQCVATHGGEEYSTGDLDPDDAATVLLPAGLRDAMELTRDELGAQLLERRGAA